MVISLSPNTDNTLILLSKIIERLEETAPKARLIRVIVKIFLFYSLMINFTLTFKIIFLILLLESIRVLTTSFILE